MAANSRGAEIIAVLADEHEHLLGAIMAQLGGEPADQRYPTRRRGLKVVVGGLVVESVSRDDVVQLVEPSHFRPR